MEAESKDLRVRFLGTRPSKIIGHLISVSFLGGTGREITGLEGLCNAGGSGT